MSPVGECRDRWIGVWSLAVAALVFAASGCHDTTDAPVERAEVWDLERAEFVEWQADDPSFNQDFAIEASGLAATRSALFIPSEKYSRLLVLDRRGGTRVGVVRLDVPRHSELEGLALNGEGLLLCDEAHAAVYEMADVRDVLIAAASGGLPVPLTKLELEGIAVRGGKIGFEGIEVDPQTGVIVLLLERTGTADTGCTSRIFRLRRAGSSLVSQGEPLEVQLEDCAWRLTGLAWWGGRLIALKTQYPGERYEVVAVDLDSGALEVLLEMTDFLRTLPTSGWSNNVEGIAVAEDGALWLVADNAWTGVIDDPVPPPIDVRTALLRIPLHGGP